MTNAEPFEGLFLNQERVEPPPAVVPKAVSPSSPAASADDAAVTIRRLQSDNVRLFDRLLRTQAEFENSRKRMQREREEYIDQANAGLIRALLPSLDAFERALKDRDQRVPDGFYQGMELVYGGLLQVLERAGLARIEVLGHTFDPHLHQAVEVVEDEGRRDR